MRAIAATDGGGILDHGAVPLTVNSLSPNIATGDGGGLADVSSGPGTAATFTGSAVTGNSVALSGGGFAAIGSTATTLTGTTVTTDVGVLGGVYRVRTPTASPITANTSTTVSGVLPRSRTASADPLLVQGAPVMKRIVRLGLVVAAVSAFTLVGQSSASAATVPPLPYIPSASAVPVVGGLVDSVVGITTGAYYGAADATFAVLNSLTVGAV
jgi:hypothetical protein